MTKELKAIFQKSLALIQTDTTIKLHHLKRLQSNKTANNLIQNVTQFAERTVY